jgi:predicted HicB family RNase H-like nuclease
MEDFRNTRRDDLARYVSLPYRMEVEILAGWLELALEDGQQIPEPEPTPEYSGKFLVRLPKSLHRSLAEAARSEGVSLNAYVTAILADGPAWRVPARKAQPTAGV